MRQTESGAKTTKEDLLRAVRVLKQAGFGSMDIGVNIMIGLPNQDFREIEDLIEICAKLKVRIFLEEYSPMPQTPDYLNSGLSLAADPLLLLHNNSAFSQSLTGRMTIKNFKFLKIECMI